MALSERVIRDAKPTNKTSIIWDQEVKGLGVRVTSAGTKAFILNYRVGGRERRATLARCSEISLKSARKRAGQELAAIRSGESDPLERRRKAQEAPTMTELIDQFLTVEGPARISHGRMTERTLKEYGKQARAYILPSLGKHRVTDVKRGDVEHIVASLPAPTRNRVLALASRLFTLAERWQWRAQNDNPARGIERSREQVRDRTLSLDELSALGEALDALEDDHPAAVNVIRLCAMTGMRIGEVLSIRWSDINFEGGRVTLRQTKAGRQIRAVPIAALALFDGLPRLNGCEWVFSTNGRAPVGYKHARAVFAEACEHAKIQGARLHDLRRTIATGMAAAGVGLVTMRDALGHLSTAMPERYARMADAAVATAIEDTGGAIATVICATKGNVVPMERRRG